MSAPYEVATLDPEFSWPRPRKATSRCICGGCNERQRERDNNTRAARVTPCRHYKGYSDGYCRSCGHSRACCKGNA